MQRKRGDGGGKIVAMGSRVVGDCGGVDRLGVRVRLG